MPATVEHQPDGYACNMGYVVVQNGTVIHRGPEWSCKLRANAIKRGQSLYSDRLLYPYGVEKKEG